MALYKGSLTSQISGSVEGTTFTRGRSGTVMRARTIPTDPRTTRQQVTRANMASGATAWAALTAVQRAAWNLYGLSTPVLNRLGDPIRLSGIAQYLRQYTVAKLIGDTPVSDGPTTFNLGPAPQFDPDSPPTVSVASGIVIPIINVATWLPTGATAVVKMGRPQGAGRSYFSGPWRYAFNTPGTATPPTTLSGAVPFAVTANQRVWLEVSVLQADGRLTDGFKLGPVTVTT